MLKPISFAAKHKQKALIIYYSNILQVNQLAYCTDRTHVENLKAIHLSSITDVIKAINHQVDVSSCSVYTEKTLISGKKKKSVLKWVLFLLKMWNQLQKWYFLISATSESNEISHQQHQQQPPAQPQIVASKASRTDVWLSFWLMSTALSLSLCALRD